MLKSALCACALISFVYSAEHEKASLELWNAADYAQHSSVQQTHFERFFDYNSLFGCSRVLDIGCGDGRLTARLADYLKQGEVVGIDSSTDMIHYANQLFPHDKHKNLKFEQVCAQDFHFDAPFDYILSIHTMHWIQEQEKTLKNIYDHLTPGGKVFFILAPSKEGLPFDLALKQTLGKWGSFFKDFKTNQNFYDTETYRRFLVNAGFHVDGIHYLFTETLHNNKLELTHWLKQWLPYYKTLPSDTKEEFMQQLVNNYLTTSQQTQKEVPIVWGEYVLVIKASKLKRVSP